MSAERLANKYSVVRRLAIGGMGEVLLAEFDGDAELSAGLLVVKRILSAAPGLPPNESQVRMLLEEGRLGLRLSHENLVETFRIENDATSPLLVIELLAGRSMAQVLGQAKKRQEMVPWEVSLAILRGACCGLHFAHTLKGPDGQSLGLVHRDVSPANIFVTFDGKVKVIDFGVAKSEDSEVKTATGILKGKLGYMSPEQSLGASKLTPAADVWSLGVFFWEMLLAERLFNSPNPTATLLQISQKPIPLPRSIRRDVPAAVEALAMKMLARPLEERFASCAEVVAAIDAIVESGAVDVGGFLAGRFPDEAQSGSAEAARCARRKGQTYVATGLQDGAVGNDPAEEDEFATAILPSSLREQLLSATGPMVAANGGDADDNVDDLATIRVSPDVVKELRANSAKAAAAPHPSPIVDDDDIATRRVDADIAKRVREQSVTERNPIEPRPERAPSGTSPRKEPQRSGLQVTPSPTSASAPSSSPPRQSDSGQQRAAPNTRTPAPQRPSMESSTLRVAPSFPQPTATSPAPLASPTPVSPSDESRTFPVAPSLESRTVPVAPGPLSATVPVAPGPLSATVPVAPGPQTAPPSRAPTTVSATASTSWLAVAVGTFGALVVLMGVAFSMAMPSPQPRFVAYQHLDGYSVIVGDRAQVPVGRAAVDIDVAHAALTKSLGADPQPVDPVELEARLRESGVWARAALPTTSKAKTAALLPLLIVGIGLLALAFAVPTMVMRGTARLVLQATLMLLTVALVLLMLQRGGLSWPGYAAFRDTPSLEWR